MSPASYRAAPPRDGYTQGYRTCWCTSKSCAQHLGDRGSLGGLVFLHRIVETLQRLPVVGEVAALLRLPNRIKRTVDLLQRCGFGRRQLRRPGTRWNGDRRRHLGCLTLAWRRRGGGGGRGGRGRGGGAAGR